ncbi:hypothetical protein J7L05_10015 [bacterium]|nr:hypothetical protein [bacterium]
MEELKDYKQIEKSEIDGYMVHIYEWVSPSGLIDPKHIVAVHLKKEHKINIEIKTFTEDLQSSMALIDDRLLTGDVYFDAKMLVYGQYGELALPVFTDEIKHNMMDDDLLRMSINPFVIVIRRFGEARKSEKLDPDIKMAIQIAKIIENIPESVVSGHPEPDDDTDNEPLRDLNE